MLQNEDAAGPLIDVVTMEEPLDTPITIFAPSDEAFTEISDVLVGLDPELVLAVCSFLLA